MAKIPALDRFLKGVSVEIKHLTLAKMNVFFKKRLLF